MNKQDAISILQSRIPVSTADKYTVKVSNCSDLKSPRALAKGGSVVAIANFNAMNPYHQEQAGKDLAAGEFSAALNHNLTLGIRDTDYRPEKGEIVDIEVGYITTKDGQKALMVTSLTPRKAKQVTAKCDFSAFLEESVEAEINEEELD